MEHGGKRTLRLALTARNDAFILYSLLITILETITKTNVLNCLKKLRHRVTKELGISIKEGGVCESALLVARAGGLTVYGLLI